MAPTILVVDDDDDIRTVTRIALEKIAGWTVLLAPDGPTALELARLHQPDAVLLDMMMPGMDGLTTFDHLEADPLTQAIPVILFTAKRNVGGATAWGTRAIRGVVPKPFDPLGLPEQLTRMLRWVDNRPVRDAV